MKKIKNNMFVLFMLVLFFLPEIIRADYHMICTFFDNPEARIYSVSNEGDISFDYYLDMGAYPMSIEFSPNGKWGLVGCWTTSYPPTQKTIILGVDSNRDISVIGTVHNEYYWLVAISPDSRYGVYGCDLKSLRIYPNGTYVTIPTDYPVVSGYQTSFSSLSRKFFIEDGYKRIHEYEIAENGKTRATGFSLDISPSSGNEDLRVSPDGKTCIILSIGDYQITVLRIHIGGGFSLSQQFNTGSLNPKEVRFTPDSMYAVVSFSTGYPDLRIFRIDWDSTLTETDNIYLPNEPGEDMAIAPDGKYVVTRALINNFSFFYVVRVHEDGTLEYLPEKDYVCSGHVSAMAFIPPEVTCVNGVWGMYE